MKMLFVLVGLVMFMVGCATVNQEAINKELMARKQLPIEQRLEKLERDTLELKAALGYATDSGTAIGIAVGSSVW